MMKAKKYYIETYGCQMNEADSEIISGILETENYILASNPESADLILVNTCSVRQNAENRAINRLGQYAYLKKKNPDLLLGMVGCVAQRGKKRIQIEHPFIDLVLGPDSYRNILDILEKHEPIVLTRLSRTELYTGINPKRDNSLNAWISIMRGCNKFCTYCIVPYTRGRERSRSIQDIVTEVKKAVAEGKPEVTLLGQNVNSYQYEETQFPELLEAVAGVPGLKRIRFTSPHPQDVDMRMLEVMRDHDNICNHIHLPLQAGSSRVLRLMKRSYNQEHFLKIASLIREYLPSAAVTTDIIVGFPQENDKDFQETLAVMENVKFDTAFMFKYSPRPGTKAAKMEDDVSEDEKSKRLNAVIALQKRHTLERNQALVGTVQEVLVEGVSKKNSEEKTGRTDSNKTVIIKEGHPGIGDFVDVEITDTAGVSLFGKVI